LFFFINSFFLSLDPLANGLRRRAQSLNFAIRSNQPSIDNTRQNTSTLPAAKRRRKEVINTICISENNSLRGKSRSKYLSQQIIQTRKKSSSVIIKNDLLTIPQKINKTTRRRRRTDPFIRMKKEINFSINKILKLILGKRRITKINRDKIDISNLVSIPSTDQTLSSESLLSSVQSPLSFTYENSSNSNIPITK